MNQEEIKKILPHRDNMLLVEEAESVELITPIAIEVGLRFAIREGGRTVGSGAVIAINE